MQRRAAQKQHRQDHNLRTAVSNDGLDPAAFASCTPAPAAAASAVYLPALALTKSIVDILGASSCSAGNVDVLFSVKVRNIGNVPLGQFELTDPLLQPLYTGVAGQAVLVNSTAAVAPVLGSAPAVIAQSGLLLPGQEFTIEYTVEIDPSASDTATSSATCLARGLKPTLLTPIVLHGSNTPLTAFDVCDGGNDPESTNPGAPGDTGCYDDALVIVVPQISMTKRVFECVMSPVGCNLADVTLEYIVKNTGNVSLKNVQEKFQVTFDSDMNNAFVVHKPNGDQLRFNMHRDGLYYHDP